MLGRKIIQKTFMLSELVDFLKREGFLITTTPFSEIRLEGFSPILEAKPNTVSLISGQLHEEVKLESVVILCSIDCNLTMQFGGIFIPVKEPRTAFARSMANFIDIVKPFGIAESAKVSKSCKIAQGVSIGEYTVIEDDVSIGKNTNIESHVCIKTGTLIGENCIIRSGAVIGNEGFGFYKLPSGTWERFLQIGNIIIEDNVEIGSNTIIDRAGLGSSIIGRGTKIDSHVYIAHNAKVGNNNIITANVTIAGSVSTGNHVWIGPSSSILEGCHIGDKAYIGMGTVVINSVDSHCKIVGVPGRVISKKSNTD